MQNTKERDAIRRTVINIMSSSAPMRYTPLLALTTQQISTTLQEAGRELSAMIERGDLVHTAEHELTLNPALAQGCDFGTTILDTSAA